MTATTAPFDEIERNANRARAYALLAQTSKRLWVGTILLWKLSRKVKGFVKLLTPELVEAVPSPRVKEMTASLQELHRLLVSLADPRESRALLTMPVPKSLRESTEDLGDIIEDLVLANNPEYQGLVAACAASLGLPPTDESSAQTERSTARA